MEKTGKEARQLDTLPLRFGSFAEEFVASEYARATGFELLHDESTHIHPEHSFMSAHIDRFVLENGSTAPSRILECKTANPFFTSSEWGEVGSDEVPMSYLCQCIWYAAITNLDRVDLAVLFGNSDFRIYEITRDLRAEQMVLQKATTFWQEHVSKILLHRQ
jgi:predicted phage-related endonuclease